MRQGRLETGSSQESLIIEISAEPVVLAGTVDVLGLSKQN